MKNIQKDFRDLSNEEKLIVLLSRMTFNDQNICQIQEILNQNLDWNLIFSYLIKNKVVTLAWYNLRKYDFEFHIPKYLRNIFEITIKGVKEQNIEYLKAIKEFEKKKPNELVCLPLKGAFLIQDIYDERGIRFMGDADFLVGYRQIAELQTYMRSLGYIQGKLDKDGKSIVEFSRETELLWKINMTNLYPYRRLTSNKFLPYIKFDFRFALERKENKASVDEICEKSINDLARPEHFFVHICSHLYDEAILEATIVTGKDYNLIKFCDIREYYLKNINADEKIVNRVVIFAQNYNLIKAVYFCLYYLKLIYNDGYENGFMRKLDINDSSFLESFKCNGIKIKWKKDFWDRIFSFSNADEITLKSNVVKYL